MHFFQFPCNFRTSFFQQVSSSLSFAKFNSTSPIPSLPFVVSQKVFIPFSFPLKSPKHSDNHLKTSKSLFYPPYAVQTHNILIKECFCLQEMGSPYLWSSYSFLGWTQTTLKRVVCSSSEAMFGNSLINFRWIAINYRKFLSTRCSSFSPFKARVINPPWRLFCDSINSNFKLSQMWKTRPQHSPRTQ